MAWYNDPEFKPKGNALKYWTLLPQTETTFDNEEIPSLFGELKIYIEISYALLLFLVVSEIYVFTKVNEMGVDAGMIALFCFFDFLVVILPHLAYESSPNRLISIINANLYIEKQKKIIGFTTGDSTQSETNEREEVRLAKFHAEVENNIKKWSGRKTWHFIFSNVFIFCLLSLLFYAKIERYYSVYGSDMLVEPTGQIVIGVGIVSVIIHLFCTTIVYHHQWHWRSRKAQLKKFNNKLGNINKEIQLHNLNFVSTYNGAKSKRHKLGKLLEMKNNEPSIDTNVRNVHSGKEEIVIGYLNIVSEDDIMNLYTGQPNDGASKAVIAECKRIQLKSLT